MAPVLAALGSAATTAGSAIAGGATAAGGAALSGAQALGGAALAGGKLAAGGGQAAFNAISKIGQQATPQGTGAVQGVAQQVGAAAPGVQGVLPSQAARIAQATQLFQEGPQMLQAPSGQLQILGDLGERFGGAVPGGAIRKIVQGPGGVPVLGRGFLESAAAQGPIGKAFVDFSQNVLAPVFGGRSTTADTLGGIVRGQGIGGLFSKQGGGALAQFAAENAFRNAIFGQQQSAQQRQQQQLQNRRR